MDRRHVTALLAGFLCAGVFYGTPAFAEDCERIQEQGASYLEQCESRLKSFSLQMSDQRWQPVNGPRGKKWFVCKEAPPIESRPGMLEMLSGVPPTSEVLCPGEPLTGFAFIWLSYWQNSSKDELAILDALATSSIAAYEPKIPPSAISCPAVDVSVAAIPGRAICLKVGDANIIAAVFGDDQTAFVLAFSQTGPNADTLKENVLKTLLPKFTIERAVGDVGLLRWMP